MAATDNIIYRLKPQAGDASPHNEIGGGDILTGGTIALVDTGAEGYAWRFTGAESAVVLGATSLITGASDTGGKTMAVTLRRAANPTVSVQQMVCWTDAAKTGGLMIKRGGGTAEAIGFYATSTNTSSVFSAVVAGSVTQTYVFKLDNSVTTLQDIAKVWVETVGRSGDAPDLTGPGATLADRTLNTIQINPINGGDYYIHDLVLWSDEKTDAECAALADNLRGTLDAVAATATTLTGPASGTTGVASTNFTVGANGTITGTVTVTPGDAANGGTFTPTTVAISSGTPTATFTYTPASTGVKTISITDDGGLTDATPLSYTSNAAATSEASMALTLDAAVFAGLASVSPITVLSITMADAAFSGSASVATPGSLTLPALKNNTGTLLINETGATVYVYQTTGAHVVTKTGQTTNASGIMTITDAALVAATQYRVVVVLGSGAEGMDKVTAA